MIGQNAIARFPDNGGFGFPTGYNGESEIFETKIVKNPKTKFQKLAMQFGEGHREEIQDKVETFWLGFVGAVTF